MSFPPPLPRSSQLVLCWFQMVEGQGDSPGAFWTMRQKGKPMSVHSMAQGSPGGKTNTSTLPQPPNQLSREPCYTHTWGTSLHPAHSQAYQHMGAGVSRKWQLGRVGTVSSTRFHRDAWTQTGRSSHTAGLGTALAREGDREITRCLRREKGCLGSPWGGESPPTSRRKYQKFMLVAKKEPTGTFTTPDKGWGLFLLSNQPCTEGVTCCGCLISTSLSQLETCQPSAETTSTETDILISSFPDCTSPLLGVKDDFLHKTQHPSTLFPAHRAFIAAAQSRQLGSSQSPRSI